MEHFEFCPVCATKAAASVVFRFAVRGALVLGAVVALVALYEHSLALGVVSATLALLSCTPLTVEED